jgi:hypothetical protein
MHTFRQAHLCSVAANEATFMPPATNAPEFLSWATRVLLRLNNAAPGAPESEVFSKEGAPSSEWAEAFIFMGSLAQLRKRPRAGA